MGLMHIYVKIPWHTNNKFQKAKIGWKKIKHETAVGVTVLREIWKTHHLLSTEVYCGHQHQYLGNRI